MPNTVPSPTAETRLDCIRLRGVRTHNLKNIDLDIPHGKFVVITGPSGSGKSSLAFDTIFAEGQRQFIDSLSIDARQHFNQLQRPDADLIDGLQPAVCIDQRRSAGNPRSTVATLTEIHDYLRLLLARVGEVHCPGCDRIVRRDSELQIQKWIEALPTGSRLMLAAPMVRDQTGGHEEVFQEIRKNGFVRAQVDGELIDLEQFDAPLAPEKKHSILAIVDRLVVRDGFESRLSESIRHALKHGNQSLVVLYESKKGESKKGESKKGESKKGESKKSESTKSESRSNDAGQSERRWIEESFTTGFSCGHCGVELDEIEPRSFSFNSPHGACPTCHGIGAIVEFAVTSVIPVWNLPLGRAIGIWKQLTKAIVKKHKSVIEKFLDQIGFNNGLSLAELTDDQREQFLRGDGEKFLGLLTLLEKEYVTTTDTKRLRELERFRGETVCPDCHGSRLNNTSNGVRLGGKNTLDIISMTISEAIKFFETLNVDKTRQAIADRIVPEIIRRLDFLRQVGAEYLTLGRSITTLSGGEFQRVRLATGIGSGLSGICYVLDEPSIGLHQRDNDRLIQSLKNLQQNGNTLIIVEHDESMMRQAEYLIDVGPAAGTRGGNILSAGIPQEVLANEKSSTVRYLNGTECIEIPTERRALNPDRMLKIEGATVNNLQNVSATIPLGVFCCITGVSGSGKSSLVNATLIPAITRELGGTSARCGAFSKLSGVSFNSLVEIDQSPIGRSSRSNAVTYTGVFDDIRKIFAATRQAKQMGFNASRFSFNAKTGRCEKCEGHGTTRIEMSFLPDIPVTCEACDGRRFNRQTLSVRFKGRSIADVLNMPVDEAVDFFTNHEKIGSTMRCLQDVGLGYLPLGQASSTISGGEAQRIKLATSLADTNFGNTIYFLDEPTTGLHFVDIKRLLNVLQRLVDKGNSVVVIEHNLDVIAQSDWVIDMGPEGGSGGGEVVATGTPEEVSNSPVSHTGRFLKPMLGNVE